MNRLGASLLGCSALVVLVLSTGCSSLVATSRFDPQQLSWPLGDPRVGLERIIANRRDTGGASLLTWLGGGRDEPLFVRPYGVAWHGDSLLVSDPGAGRVLRIDAGGRVTTCREGLLDGPMGVAVCAGGIVVSDARRGGVALLDERLSLRSWLATGLDRPTGIACLDGQTIVLTETGGHRLLLLADDGSRRVIGSRGPEPGRFNFPTSVAVSKGSLWIGDTLNFRVQQIDPVSGAALAEFGRLGDAAGEMPRIKGVAVDRDGHLWISDAYLDQVALYTSAGELLLTLGRSGDEPGELAFPAGIAAHPDGRVAVVDSLNRRVQVLRLLDRPQPAAHGGEQP